MPLRGSAVYLVFHCLSFKLELMRARGREMRACVQSVAIWFFLVVCGFILTQPASLGIGAEPSKHEFISNAQFEPERLLERDVRRFIDTHPGVSTERITAYANSALQKYGYIYKFDICKFIDSKKLEPLNSGHDPTVTSIYSLPFDLARGGRRSFKIPVEDVGPCTYCFTLIPAINVTSQNILAVLNGKRYFLKRPADFPISQAELVDKTMKRGIRKWEMPSQDFLIGISDDGLTLYLPVEFTESDHDANMWLLWKEGKKSYPSSVLAISQAGFRFEVAATALAADQESEDILGQECEDILNFPEDAKGDYSACRRFRVKGKTYIIRYSGPCT